MASNTLDCDLVHLHRFPAQKRQKILRAIMERPSASEQICDGAHCYENTVTRLHAQGYQLIDLNPQETMLTAVWYRKTTSWFGLRSEESAIMLVWESGDGCEKTTLCAWQL